MATLGLILNRYLFMTFSHSPSLSLTLTLSYSLSLSFWLSNPLSHCFFFKKNGSTPASICLFSVFSNKQYNFYNKSMWKNVHLLYAAGIRTQDRVCVSLFFFLADCLHNECRFVRSKSQLMIEQWASVPNNFSPIDGCRSGKIIIQ